MPLEPGYYRDIAVCGNTLQRQYTCKDSNDAAVDLTGYTVVWRAVYGDVMIEKSTADGGLDMPTPSNGTISLMLTPEETRLVPVNDNMKYELELVSSGGAAQTTVLWGDLVGKGGVNRD